ncbi:MAG: hypothetical protein H0Z35_05500 [Thermoanaerobacteraceae bacterium]|nr:hypothetical protein [Thermoanaerobacteraceae bacterium]
MEAGVTILLTFSRAPSITIILTALTVLACFARVLVDSRYCCVTFRE